MYLQSKSDPNHAFRVGPVAAVYNLLETDRADDLLYRLVATTQFALNVRSFVLTPHEPPVLFPVPVVIHIMKLEIPCQRSIELRHSAARK